MKVTLAGMNADNSPFYKGEGRCPRCGLMAAFNSVAATRHSVVMQCAHCRGLAMCDGVRASTPFTAQPVHPFERRAFPHETKHVPELLLTALEESYAAFSIGAYSLAGLGARVVLERLVQGFGYRDRRPLEERLQQLRASKPELEGALVHADAIRLIGNGAAHEEFRNLTQEEADATLVFTEEVLRAVYILPELRKRIVSPFQPKQGGDAE